jgi:hypothetical protein
METKNVNETLKGNCGRGIELVGVERPASAVRVPERQILAK